MSCDRSSLSALLLKCQDEFSAAESAALRLFVFLLLPFCLYLLPYYSYSFFHGVSVRISPFSASGGEPAGSGVARCRPFCVYMTPKVYYVPL